MSEWNKFKLTQVGILNRGKSKYRPRYAFHLYGGKYPFIQTGEIKAASKYINSFEQTYSEAGLAQSKLWPKGTLCITIAANIAETAILNLDACFPDSVLGFIPDDKLCDLDFVFYTLKHFQKELQVFGDGSVQDNINLGTFDQISFPFPPLPEQRAIAGVLSSLDDKIALLNRQNRTLEGMAEALWRKMFVEEAETGWKRGKLGDIADNVRESVSVKNLQRHEHYVGLEHLERKHIALYSWENTAEIESNKSLFKRKDVLFGKLRAYFHKVCFAPIDGICSTDILVIRPKGKDFFSFCLLWFFNEDVVNYSDASSSGTRMPRTNWDTLSGYEIAIPPEEVIVSFNDKILPMIDKINQNIFSIRTLAHMRDTLLPKLMSGDIRVNNE